ncbi:hypothetical protein J2T13_004571 [Paenibacillus sp. DS2015]
MNEMITGLFHIPNHRENLYLVEVFLFKSQDKFRYQKRTMKEAGHHDPQYRTGNFSCRPI